MLYLTTFVMGVGIAFMQPALPALVREWLPERVGLGTAAFTNGIVVGVALVAALTIPVVLPLVGQSWRLDLVVWASPVLATAVLLLFFADRPAAQPGREKLSARIWWPDWRSPLIWLLGLTFGSNNALYFGSNAILPDYLVSLGRPDLVGAAIGWLNSAQLVASFFLLAAAERLHRRAWPFLVFGLLAFAGVLAIIGANDYWIVAAAGLVGFCTAFTFVLTMALPPLLSLPDDVHRTSAGMFTISYTFGLFVPVISGALWDLTGVPASAFVPLAVCALTLMTFGSFLCLQGQRLAHPPN
jgi:CP family cyanate transporter-like MFS transporter